MVGCLLSHASYDFRDSIFLLRRGARGLYAAGSPAVPAYALRLVAAHFALYVPLGPFMILNMAGNRKRAFKKRAQAAHLDGEVGDEHILRPTRREDARQGPSGGGSHGPT